MKAARAPRADKTSVKLLVVKDSEIEDSSIERLPDHLRSGDLLAVNDAATLPASLPARDARNNRLELRLTKQLDERSWQAAVFGAGVAPQTVEDELRHRRVPHQVGPAEHLEMPGNGGLGQVEDRLEVGDEQRRRREAVQDPEPGRLRDGEQDIGRRGGAHMRLSIYMAGGMNKAAATAARASRCPGPMQTLALGGAPPVAQESLPPARCGARRLRLRSPQAALSSTESTR